ncbi:MAG: O-antigen ligase family protein [Clostridia bacterium]|nr:O-antigen ligase family protein [Clostridia bacterium]
MKGGFKQWLSDFVGGSGIIRGLSSLANGIYKRIGSGIYGFAFGSYDTMCETYDSSAVGKEQNQKRGKISSFISRNIEESVYINGINAMMRYLGHLSLRVLGIFLISAGFYTLLAQTIIYLVTDSLTPLSIIVALIMAVLGLPLVFSGKALCTALSESAFLGNFVRNFCSVKERSLRYDGEPTGRKGIAFILGLPFGILSCFIDPALIVVLALAIVFAYLVMSNPEFGYNIALFLLPFLVVLPHPTILLAALVLFTFFSYWVKLVRGKRYYKTQLLDVIVVCFMAVMMLGGIVTYGGSQSLRAALIYTVLMLGYFLTTGLVNSKEALKRSVKIIAFSLLIVSVYGIFQNFSGNASAEWIDTEMFDEIEGRVVSTFENPNMLGEYLILILPMLAAAVLGESNWRKRPSYFVCFALGCVCLVYTWSRGAWLGLMFAAVLFMLMWSRNAMGLIIAGICAIPFAVPFLPESIVSRFTSIGDLTDTSTNYRVFIWRGSAEMAADYALSGVGVGEEAFGVVYPYYAFSGIESAPHAHNLFLQLFIQHGIFGFIVFAALLLCFFQCGFSLAKCGADREIRLIGCGAFCGVLAALVQGMTDYVWYNYRVFFVFWIMMGFVAVAYRLDKAWRGSNTVLNSPCNMDVTV